MTNDYLPTPEIPYDPGRLQRDRGANASYGIPLPILFGTYRIKPSIILSGIQMAGTYGADLGLVQVALCEGTINSVLAVWREQTVGDTTSFGLTVATGTLPQSPWAHLTGPLAPLALGYGGVALASCATGHVTAATGELERTTFEVRGLLATQQDGSSTAYDAKPWEILEALLTSNIYGLDWDSSILGDQSSGDPFQLGADGTTASGWARYCDANAWYISLAVTEQRPVSEIVQEVLTATDSVALWSEGTLKIRPLGETTVVGSVTYTPHLTPVYNLGASSAGADFLGAPGEPLVTVERVPRADTYNCHPVEWSNRFPARTDVTGAAIVEPFNAYNPDVEDGTPDPVDVAAFGLRKADPTQIRCITRATHARDIANVLTRRALYTTRNRYRFRLGWRFALLEPTDLVTITDATLGLDGRLVRITEIEEGEDGAFDVAAEEVGTVASGGAATYSVT